MIVWKATQVLLTVFLVAESGVVPREKNGHCPPQITMKPGYCNKDGSICTTDDHCQEDYKCCNNSCHNECLKPNFAEVGVLVVHATYHYNDQSESTFTGTCTSKKDCPRYAQCLDDMCKCMFGISKYDEHGHIQKCRASLIFSEYDETTALLAALGISLLIFFGYFIIGKFLLCGVKRLRRPGSSSADLSSPLTKDSYTPVETTPLSTGQYDVPTKKESSINPSTSNIYPQLDKKRLNDNIMP